MIGEHNHVVGLVSDPPSVPTVGAAVPGPVMRDQAHPEPPIEILVRPPLQPAPRCAVKRQHGKPVRIAPHGERQRAPLGAHHRSERFAQLPKRYDTTTTFCCWVAERPQAAPTRRHAARNPVSRAAYASFARASLGYPRCRRGGTPVGRRGGVSKSENGVPHVRHEVAGNEVTMGVAWLWCIAGCLGWWVLVAWAVERVV